MSKQEISKSHSAHQTHALEVGLTHSLEFSPFELGHSDSLEGMLLVRLV